MGGFGFGGLLVGFWVGGGHRWLTVIEVGILFSDTVTGVLFCILKNVCGVGNFI